MLPPTSAIADVLQLRGREGWLSPPLLPVHRAPAVLGTARTVRLAAGPGGLTPLHRLLDEDLGGRVIVIAGAEAAAGAVWGEILTVSALRAGAVGAVVEGGVRDVGAVRELGLPLWALHEATAGPGPLVHVAAVGERVSVAGVPVADGDMIVMDGGGVVAVPDRRVLADAGAYAAAEADVVNALREGASLAEAYRHKADLVAALRAGHVGRELREPARPPATWR
ncbi:RraA family protein [Streptosporangium roseum]|uniref:RraA family protein n=1 Tax=Streptosporangium roseum TaxID=2001 RepID=UPI00068BF61B|nr:RraA family protein [Streptosporangium roseum]